jgi:hypothetical protein
MRIGRSSLEHEGKMGYGRKNPDQICDELNIDVALAIRRLAENNINADAESMIREIAEKSHQRPIDIVNIIKMEKQ